MHKLKLKEIDWTNVVHDAMEINSYSSKLLSVESKIISHWFIAETLLRKGGYTKLATAQLASEIINPGLIGPLETRWQSTTQWNEYLMVLHAFFAILPQEDINELILSFA